MLYRMDTAAIVDELARLVAAHYVFANVGRGDRPGADPRYPRRNRARSTPRPGRAARSAAPGPRAHGRNRPRGRLRPWARVDLPLRLEKHVPDLLAEPHVAGVGDPARPGVAGEFGERDPQRPKWLALLRRGRPPGLTPHVQVEAVRGLRRAQRDRQRARDSAAVVQDKMRDVGQAGV